MGILSAPNPVRFSLFGPVLTHDLVRTARRGRYVLVRFLYASLLAAVLFWVFHVWSGGFSRGTVSPEELARFVENFFAQFMAVQFGLAVLLTPAYTAAAVSDEKERRTLEFLLATDLSSREIVLGKLAARLANVLLLVITGLPVLSLVQLLGGVDPNLIVAGFVVLVVSVVSLAALSILVSVYARTSRRAVVGSYLAAAAYLFLSGLVYVVVLKVLPGQAELKNLPKAVLVSVGPPLTVEGLVNALSAGNVFVVGYRAYEELAAGKALSAFLPALTGGYALAHAVTAVACCSWASLRLRAVALQECSVNIRTRQARRSRKLPAIGRWPLLWKEVYASRRTRLRTLGQLLLFVLGLAALLLPGTFLIDSLAHGFSDAVGAAVNGIVGWTAAAVAGLMLVAVLVGAAGSVSGERDRQTWDSLLATPLEARPILLAKWLGCLLRCGWAWLWLGVIWVEALFLGGPDWAALPLLLVCWLGYAALLAMIGLWFSISCRTSLRALFCSLFTAAALCVGHWLLWVGYLPFLMIRPDPAEAGGRLALVHLGLTPPAVLAWFATSPRELFSLTDEQLTRLGICAGVGWLCWVLAAGVFGRLTLRRLRARTARAAVSRPELEVVGRQDDATIVARLRCSHRRSRRRIVLAITSTACVLAALLVGPYYYVDFIASRELRAAVAEVEANDPHWRFEDVEAERAAIPDEQNSALRVTKAKQILAGVSPSNALRTMVSGVPAEVQLDAYQAHRLRTEMDRAAPVLAELDALARLPRGRYVVAWNKDFLIATLLTHLQDAREIAIFLRLNAVRQAQDGDADAALRTVRATINTARSLGDEPMIISLLVRVAIDAVAVSTLQRVVAQGEASDADLRDVQAALEQEAGEPLLTLAIRGERAFSDAVLRQTGNQEVSLTKLAGGATGTSIPTLDRMGGAAFKYSRAWTLRWLTRALEVSRRPAHEWFPELDELGRESVNLPLLARMLTPAVVKVAESVLRNQASFRCAAVAVAAERFRRANGRWPDCLDELVAAGLLREVPPDPYGGRPLRLARREGRLVIYSVGVDRQDNGGNIAKNPSEKGADIGFRLWDADKRRQPPRNPEVGPPLPDRE